VRRAPRMRRWSLPRWAPDSLAPTRRRVHVAVQVARLFWRASPGDRAAAAWEKADAVAFGLGAERPAEPAHDAERLIIFLNVRVDPADITLLAADLSARLAARLAESGAAADETARHHPKTNE